MPMHRCELVNFTIYILTVWCIPWESNLWPAPCFYTLDCAVQYVWFFLCLYLSCILHLYILFCLRCGQWTVTLRDVVCWSTALWTTSWKAKTLCSISCPTLGLVRVTWSTTAPSTTTNTRVTSSSSTTSDPEASWCSAALAVRATTTPFPTPGVDRPTSTSWLMRMGYGPSTPPFPTLETSSLAVWSHKAWKCFRRGTQASLNGAPASRSWSAARSTSPTPTWPVLRSTSHITPTPQPMSTQTSPSITNTPTFPWWTTTPEKECSTLGTTDIKSSTTSHCSRSSKQLRTRSCRPYKHICLYTNVHTLICPHTYTHTFMWRRTWLKLRLFYCIPNFIECYYSSNVLRRARLVLVHKLSLYFLSCDDSAWVLSFYLWTKNK